MEQPRRTPEFPRDLPWVGAGDRPPRFDGELQGRVVLVCFWTASSIHCEVALGALALLQLRFADRPFVALGVHSARSAGERGVDTVAASVRRARVRCPVLVDDDRHVFDGFGCHAWPTFVLVDSSGDIRFHGAGEPDLDRLGAALEVLCGESVANAPPPWPAAWPERANTARTALSWPAGLAVDGERELLWIADGGRDRILGVELGTGVVRHEIGCGLRGFADGEFDLAAFAGPRGLSVTAGGLLVADSLNHALRRVQLEDGQVTTVCGDGSPQWQTGLGAPTAVAVQDAAEAVVSAAAFHQLRRVSLPRHRAEVLAGTGVAGLTDGQALDALLAEPRALAVRDAEIAFVDAGTDAVRVLDTAAGYLATWLDGQLDAPCGVAWWRGGLLVCDTFGNRVLRVVAPGRTPEVLVGADFGLARPESIAVHDGRAYVADTGNHRIVTVDLESGDIVEFPLLDDRDAEEDAPLTPVELRAGGLVSISAHIPRPDGARIDGVCVPLALAGSLDGEVMAPVSSRIVLEGEWGVLRGASTGPPGACLLRMVFRYATRAHHAHARHVIERDVVRAARLTADGPDAIEL